MDAVRVEHALAGILGVKMGKRGEVNDADAIRSAEAKYFIAAVIKMAPLWGHSFVAAC